MFKGYFAPFFTHLDIGVAVFFLIFGVPAVPAVRCRRARWKAGGRRCAGSSRRRLLRIFPAYWLALIGIMIFFGLPVPVGGARSYIEYFTLLQTYDTIKTRHRRHLTGMDALRRV